MSGAHNGSDDPSVKPTRVLIAGSNLLAGALARTLETHGFATRYIAASAQEIERNLKWRPDLVLIDLRPFDVDSGSTIVESAQRSGRQVCVIDYGGDSDRPSAWLRAGSAAVVSENEPFNQLFKTITRLTRIAPPRSVPRAPVASTADPPDARRRTPRSRAVRHIDRTRTSRAVRTHGRQLRRGHREGGHRVDLDGPVTDQGHFEQARGELPTGCRWNGTACRVVPGTTALKPSETVERPASPSLLTENRRTLASVRSGTIAAS